MSGGLSQSEIAQKTWEMSNNIEEISKEENIYTYDGTALQQMLAAKPWEKDVHFFKDCRISALALLKMTMHARSGGNIEIMGLLLGKVDGNVMVVMDAFALPVEGTETRVNAHEQGYEYMTQYMESAKKVGRLENAIGWYHSHPGYGCWLSGIDCSTQQTNQSFQDPFVAIVVDPVRTISAGKVNIGAFRTYPKGFKPPDEGPGEYQTIPLNKIEDFGVHCKSYYSMNVSYFKSPLDKQLLDRLWNHYWVNTLSSSSLLTNAEYTTGQINDLADKLETWDNSLSRSTYAPESAGVGVTPGTSGGSDKKVEDKLGKATKDATKITSEVLQGIMSQVIKDKLFNHKATAPNVAAEDPSSGLSVAVPAAVSAPTGGNA